MGKVTVTYSGDPLLNLNPSSLTIGAHDNVLWEFVGAPPGAVPAILFDVPLGPFQFLRAFRDAHLNPAILGRGNVGPDAPSQTYPYRVFLLNIAGPVAASPPSGEGAGTIHNQAHAKNSSPEAIVQYNRSANSLDVDPQTLDLFAGDTVVWHVFGLQPGEFISFNFPGYEDPLVGPFKTIEASRGVLGDENPDVRRVLATNFNFQHNTPLGTRGYHIVVRNQNGQLITSPDPAIDNLGSPP